MSTQNDGGPAFPRGGFRSDEPYKPLEDGMSLRDYFAWQAMHAALETLVRLTFDDKRSKVAEWMAAGRLAMARDAYLVADAMLAAREARP